MKRLLVVGLLLLMAASACAQTATVVNGEVVDIKRQHGAAVELTINKGSTHNVQVAWTMELLDKQGKVVPGIALAVTQTTAKECVIAVPAGFGLQVSQWFKNSARTVRLKP